VAEATEGITVADARRPDYALVWVNRGFLKLTGYAEPEVLGRNCRFLQGPGTDPLAVERVREAIRTRTAAVVELLNYRRDGTQFWNSLSISPVFDSSGELEFYIGVQTDITERRLREKREAEFIDNLAHELRTPLTAICSVLETLDRSLDEDVRRGLTARLHGQASRLAALLEGLLTLASLQSLPSASLEPVDLADVAGLEMETAQPLARARGLALVARIPQTALMVLGDPAGLSGLVSNLLSNAIKYTPAGGRIELSLSAQASEAVLLVQDTGIGIAPEHQSRIFERFYRVDRARGRDSGGVGIGLSLVAETVRHCGGQITLQSAPGCGSTFTVRLPLYRPAAT
jgi:PAS domain S-box-containing protein